MEACIRTLIYTLIAKIYIRNTLSDIYFTFIIALVYECNVILDKKNVRANNLEM